MKFTPHSYQKYAISFIEEHPVSVILLDMGLGKTVITLTAIKKLMHDKSEVSKVLIIAPLRVARTTWADEIRKWDHLKSLTYSIAVGTEKERLEALMQKADIYIINRENVPWLVDESGLPFDYDMLVIDELSSFKNYKAKRFKALMRVRPKVKRVVGLTGTPSSNGLMDLFAEYKILDMGEKLGRFIGQYRNNYFMPDKRNGQIVYSYKPLHGAEEKIQKGQPVKVISNDIPELTPEELSAVDLPEGATLEGSEMPKPSEYLSARQKNGVPLGADEIYKETWLWLRARGCENLVNTRLIELYSQNMARYIQCEEALSTYGLLGKHPTTGGVMASPFVSLSLQFQKSANLIWYEIYDIVKQNCTVPFNGDPRDDMMEKLLRSKKGV